ncbi:MAG: error-prone DNA polymerase [Sphingomonadaceae bacterium]|nr:error-prone DNA polymerase [Sphingomonadaceae bacterium]
MTYAELVAATNYSFLRGASHPAEMVAEAISLGLNGIGIADRNSVAAVVRAWAALNELAEDGLVPNGFRLLTGARLVFADGTPDIVAYPATRRGWGRLTRLLTVGNIRSVKGGCILKFEDLIEYLDDLLLIILTHSTADEVEWHKNPPDYVFEERGAHHPKLRLVPPAAPDSVRETLVRLKARAPGQIWLGVTSPRHGNDRRILRQMSDLAASLAIPLLAINDVLYASPDCRPLHDVLTCIRLGTTLSEAGTRLEANAERHLKPTDEMARLFADYPGAISETQSFIAAVQFTLDELRYEYPHEPVPEGWQPDDWLAHLVWGAAHERYGETLPDKVCSTIRKELDFIRDQKFAYYFLTVHDLVKFARNEKPPILCQGRGSAANSAVCFLLGVTSVDPIENNLLFSRFVSADRKEPPDIDVDFEHERREDVIRHIYERYGRHRAGIAATVIHYRPRSAVRDVGKVLGLSEDVIMRLSSTVWGSFASDLPEERLIEAGFDPSDPLVGRLHALVSQLLNFPRHLSQHVGGFVLTEDRLDETVPVHNGAMDGRTFIEWDKDDIDALGLMKVDVLALGMLTCIRKAYDMLREQGLGDYDLTVDLQSDDPQVYDMLCKGDSIGVFQVESRAQINMLPRMKPRTLYDLTIQVAIVRPGPIEGDMVHPYLRRRNGEEKVEYPSPSPEHGEPGELFEVLGKTEGVPLFQEQAMKLAITAAKFSDAEANKLRRAMATFKSRGGIDKFYDKMVEGMVARGYEREFSERCFKQIEGFGSYGFPESHALSFARLVYVSAWIKCHYPAIFAAALLNSQPMGFYAPAQIVRDAMQHGVDLRPIDINKSRWDSSIENGALRLGMRLIDGFREDWALRIMSKRPFVSLEDMARHTALPARALQLLADADAFTSLSLGRREGAWEAWRTPPDQLPLFATMEADELGEEQDAMLPVMPLSEEVAADYQMTRLSLKGHPMQFLRRMFASEGVLSCVETDAAKHGSRVKTAGVVLTRQRPGKGNAIFITIEDETGVTNALLWARLFKRQRHTVMASRLMLIEGEIQRSKEGVVHLMATTVTDRTHELKRLSEEHDANVPIPHNDEFARPVYPRHGHPRDVRILPKSRDFH